MGIIYGFGSGAGEVAAMLNGSLTTATTERITSLKMFADTANDVADATTNGSLYAIAIVQKDDNYNGRNKIFSATGSEFDHFNVEIAAAFDTKYGVSEIALAAIGSDNGSLVTLEAIGVTTGIPGNSSVITAGSIDPSALGTLATIMGSLVGSSNDLTKFTTVDWTVLGSTEDGADVSSPIRTFCLL